MSILVENISKSFGSFQALDRVNLEIKNGSLVGLLGPSGSGKSTLLRVLAGLDKPDSGRIWLEGQDATQMKLQEREIGFVFQNYALLLIEYTCNCRVFCYIFCTNYKLQRYSIIF